MLNDLFAILMLVSFVCIIVGAVKPALFSRLFKKEITKKKAILIFSSATVVFFVLFGMTAPKTQTEQKQTESQTQQTNNQKPAEQLKTNTNQAVAQNPAPQQTDQQKLEAGLKDNVSKATGSTTVSYKSLQVENSDKDRPAGTKMLTISINTSDFWDKNALIKDTGKLSSTLFQTAFNSNINAYDVIIWYYGKTKDRYGNEKDDVILTYTMDKTTFGKINWNNFDKSKMCDFLNQEDKLTGNNFNTSCITLANIQ